MKKERLSDEVLVSFIQNGKIQYYEEIIDRYQKSLSAYIYRINKDPEATDDITQETFIAAYQNINAFDTKRKFSSWLYRIAHNKAINEIKKNSRVISLDEKITLKSNENLEMIEKNITKKEARNILEKQLSLLSLKYKEVIILKYFEDKTYDEISDILKIPKNTVGVRLKRGLQKIKTNSDIKIEDYL